ncbi:MAG: hypothetical protein A2W25_15915 [candidate division Zixibacteria bacterium RBG_16_53_22]|nr:MAG: hypothetical protein A2W25_15915 [candidate division Zixibacteria bacterium RBG_16_53_22]
MEYLRQLFEYNAKFADEIIESLGTIDKSRFTVEKVSAWGSLRNLVMHLVEAEDYWINKIVQGKPFTQYDFNDFGDIDAIRDKWREVDHEILRFVGSLNVADLKREHTVKWDKEYTFPLEKILQHLYTHTVHTRGQVVAGIRALGGRAPYVDII